MLDKAVEREVLECIGRCEEQMKVLNRQIGSISESVRELRELQRRSHDDEMNFLTVLRNYLEPNIKDVDESVSSTIDSVGDLESNIQDLDDSVSSTLHSDGGGVNEGNDNVSQLTAPIIGSGRIEASSSMLFEGDDPWVGLDSHCLIDVELEGTQKCTPSPVVVNDVRKEICTGPTSDLANSSIPTIVSSQLEVGYNIDEMVHQRSKRSRREIELMKAYDSAGWDLEEEIIMEAGNKENVVNDVLNDITALELENYQLMYERPADVIFPVNGLQDVQLSGIIEYPIKCDFPCKLFGVKLEDNTREQSVLELLFSRLSNVLLPDMVIRKSI